MAGLLAMGIVCAACVDLTVPVWFLLWAITFGLLLVVLRFRRGGVRVPVLAACAVITLGALRFAVVSADRPNPALIDVANAGQAVELFGRVDAAPEHRLTGWRVPIHVIGLHTRQGSGALPTTVLLTSRTSLDSLQYGDYVRVAARLRLPHARRNPGGFDYARHLYLKGIDALAEPLGPVVRLETSASLLSPERWIAPVRRRIQAVFSAYLERIPRSLMLGFLIGDTGELPPTIMAMVRDAGTLHLLAVSGANVWLIVALVLWPLRLLRVPRWPKTLILLFVVVMFCVLARNEPSVVRASIMVAALLIGRLAHRPVHPINSLGAAAGIILLFAPLQLFRPGFQLSFAAVLAIVIVSRRVNQLRWLPRFSAVRGLVMMIVASVAATLATAPIIAWHFGEVPLVTLPANIAMIPLASMAVYLGAGLFFTNWISASLSHWLAIPLSKCLEWSVASAGYFSQLPVAVWRWPNPSPLAIACIYVVFILALNWRHRYRWYRPTVYLSLALFSLVVMRQLTGESPTGIRFALLDSGAQRYAALTDNERDVAWLADEAKPSYSLREWMIDPFRRSNGLVSDSVSYAPWRIVEAAYQNQVPGHADAPVVSWTRYTSAASHTGGTRRVWADRIAFKGRSIFHLRDYPTSPPGDAWLSTIIASDDVIVLPASLPHRMLFDLLSQFDHQRVILYGNSIPSRVPDQWLDSWRTRFPHIEFWATPVHGGMIVEWADRGIEIQPSLSETVWSDPSLQ